jgi:hypothetical protein
MTNRLTNINLLSKVQYDGISDPAPDELWAVECNPLGAPSDYYVDYAGTSDIRIAPANGYIYIEGKANSTNGWCNVTVYTPEGVAIGGMSTVGPNSGHGTFGFAVVRKGQKFNVYNSGYTMNAYRFIYAEGEK